MREYNEAISREIDMSKSIILFRWWGRTRNITEPCKFMLLHLNYTVDIYLQSTEQDLVLSSINTSTLKSVMVVRNRYVYIIITRKNNISDTPNVTISKFVTSDITIVTYKWAFG